jgi:Protein of unknown function (DUF3619)
MNAKELNFAYKVRHALNENLDYLPASTTDRLTSARELAISRKKKELPALVLAPERKVAGQVGGFFGERLSWIARMGLAVPVIVLALGLTGIYQYEKQRHIAETAEIDAMVLSDELPLNAYLDNGFNAYLAKRAE